MDTATSKSLGVDTKMSKSPGLDIATARCGYSDASFLLHRILHAKSKKRGKPPWKNPHFCTSDLFPLKRMHSLILPRVNY